ncbi:pyridoxamine 5'-phosphate oxidase family protein [Marinomonas sp. TW1]|uniref:pyridoxamine 5'-phosphate oxidase family protein n=1 Tax=Marinomonas sp. TW1 TaxID=1561203 RepID=UPI0007AF650A|nr:pyridoxamine 5'-phosphate oxidase family protein [Marinomonas sp. TW1]KZN14731.1 pyridoxamine 5'-phosphate oxidase [Marinomonas sp. TW1]
MQQIESIDALEAHYGKPIERALWKEIPYLNPHYQAFIEKSTFVILATHGENGLDCSPRGDPAGFVRVVNEHCIQLPDRRGNNRLDSLRNIIHNPKVGLIFLVPNVGETIRVSGTAQILVDQALCDSFAMQGKAASSVISIQVEKAYFQCQKAIARSGLWQAEHYIDRSELPTAGEMAKVFADRQNIEFSAEEYDKNYPDHMQKTMY